MQLLGTTSIPEHRWLGPSWDQRARGLGGTLAIPISTGGEENLLCWRNRDRYPNEDIFLHEFSHGIQVRNWCLLFLQFLNTKTLCIDALWFGLKFFFWCKLSSLDCGSNSVTSDRKFDYFVIFSIILNTLSVSSGTSFTFNVSLLQNVLF